MPALLLRAVAELSANTRLVRAQFGDVIHGTFKKQETKQEPQMGYLKSLPVLHIGCFKAIAIIAVSERHRSQTCCAPS